MCRFKGDVYILITHVSYIQFILIRDSSYGYSMCPSFEAMYVNACCSTALPPIVE